MPVYNAVGKLPPEILKNDVLRYVGFFRPEVLVGAGLGEDAALIRWGDEPVERTIEYVAPFDSCDREQDYETAWRFF